MARQEQQTRQWGGWRSQARATAVGLLLLLLTISHQVKGQENRQHRVQIGDTWAALSWRYQLDLATIRAAAPHPNRQREPTIGSVLQLPQTVEQMGWLVRSGEGGLLATAVRSQTAPWLLAIRNQMSHPYRPPLYRPLFVPGGVAPPRDLPPTFTSLELSQVPAHPGLALALRGVTTGAQPAPTITTTLNRLPFDTFQNQNRMVALGATGAFFGRGEPELAVRVAGWPLWSQPWRFEDNEWIFQQLTLTGAAAQIDQAAIDQERERLFTLWRQRTPEPLWQDGFRLPIDSYLEISSPYGARRSYNGGPYRTYHEGVDFSAYGGTAVYAPAAGIVVLAEILYVRGGAVIIDHGWGVYTGYYHLAAVHAQPGQRVKPGDRLGEVGTTGFSTGNHLHWDLLVANTWVDAQAWQNQQLACWLKAGWAEPCPSQK